MRGAAACACLAAALLLAMVAAQPLEVVQLTPSSFEHETQAASGQTTGHWCVLFVNSSAPSGLQTAAEAAWERLAGDEDKSTILAKVDVGGAAGGPLARRFNLTAAPAAILFRDRSMYRLALEGAGDSEGVAAAVHAFMDGGYEHQVPHPVPGEATLLDIVKEAAAYLQVSPSPMLYVGLTCMAIGLLAFAGIAIGGTWYAYSPDKPRAAAPAKPAAAAAAAASGKPKDEPAADDDDEDEAGVVKESGESRAAATRARRRA